VYQLDVFHAERHTPQSHFKIQTTLVLKPVVKTATISATVTPKGGYQNWIKGTSKQIDVKVP
jgi:hypothetical protein